MPVTARATPKMGTRSASIQHGSALLPASSADDDVLDVSVFNSHVAGPQAQAANSRKQKSVIYAFDPERTHRCVANLSPADLLGIARSYCAWLKNSVLPHPTTDATVKAILAELQQGGGCLCALNTRLLL